MDTQSSNPVSSSSSSSSSSNSTYSINVATGIANALVWRGGAPCGSLTRNVYGYGCMIGGCHSLFTSFNNFQGHLRDIHELAISHSDPWVQSLNLNHGLRGIDGNKPLKPQTTPIEFAECLEVIFDGYFCSDPSCDFACADAMAMQLHAANGDSHVCQACHVQRQSNR